MCVCVWGGGGAGSRQTKREMRKGGGMFVCEHCKRVRGREGGIKEGRLRERGC